jgi:hypothetical protein
MKDKRTYTHLKEHGEDMSHENESKVDPKEDRSSLDLTFMIEQHKKEIWEYKQKESEWIKTENLAIGYKKVIEELRVKALGPLPKNTSSVFLYRGTRITELAACGLTLDPCACGFTACCLMLDQVGSKA